jgi:effector-binding domain-containing protein
VLTEPRIVERDASPYLAIAASVTMDELAAVIPALIPEVFGWLAAHDVRPAGAPFARFDVIDMERRLEIEVGVPVASRVSGDARVHASVLPAGRYATLTHTGHPHGLLDANAALQKWAADQGLKWQLSGNTWGSRLEIYLTNPAEEPNMERWQTEVTYLLADD